MLNKASTCVGLLPNLVDSIKFLRDKIFNRQNFRGIGHLQIFTKKKFRGLKFLADHAHLWPLLMPI